MSQRAVLWCRSEMGNTEDLTRQNQVLSFYCKEQGMKAVRTIIEYGKADIMKLRNFRQMARYDECDVILVENFDVLDFSPDVTTEEIKYLKERGVRIVSVDEGEITPDMLPELYRKRFKVIIGGVNSVSLAASRALVMVRSMVAAALRALRSPTASRALDEYVHMLLAGLLFCGYCERKMTSFQAKSKKVTVDGNQERTFIPKYRCSSFMYPQEDACKGQSTYSAKKVEQTVINAVKRYMATLSTQDLTVSYLERIDAQIKALKSELTKRQIAQTRAIKELDTLKAEVIKALMGESKFDSVMLQELLSKKEQEVQATYADVENKEREFNGLTENRNSVFELDRRMTNWDSDFESQTIEGQKAMLFQVIDKINLFRDKVEIHINITMDLFKEGLSEQMAEPISSIINEPMAIEGEVLPAESIVAEQSNYGVVNCVSLAASRALVIMRSMIAAALRASHSAGQKQSGMLYPKATI